MANRKITEKTKVKIMNNTVGSASFRDMNGKKILFPKRGSTKTLSYGDIEQLYSEAYKMIEHGVLLPLQTDVIKKLEDDYGIDYSKIIKFDEIDKFLEEKEAKDIENFLSSAPESVKMNVAARAKETRLDSKSKSKAIKKSTGLDVDNVDETK